MQYFAIICKKKKKKKKKKNSSEMQWHFVVFIFLVLNLSPSVLQYSETRSIRSPNQVQMHSFQYKTQITHSFRDPQVHLQV